MENKSRYITPAIMLFAGAVSMIIMMVKQYEFYKMLWTLLVVLLVFFIIGDIARYLYGTIRPRVIPASIDLNSMEREAARRVEQEPDTIYLDDDFEEFESQKRYQKEPVPEMSTFTETEGFLDDDFETEEMDTQEQETEKTLDESITEKLGYSDDELSEMFQNSSKK